MHSAVFVAVIPNERSDWGQFIGHLERKQKHARKVDQLAENVWLIDAKTDLPFLGQLIALCEDRGISWRMLPLEGEPEWLPAETGPKPT